MSDIDTISKLAYLTSLFLKGVGHLNATSSVLNCDFILLCASTISTLRILLNSEYKTNSHGFKDNSGKLGKYLMDHISICRFFSVPKKGKTSESPLDSSLDLSGAGSFFIPVSYTHLTLPTNREV